MKDIITKIEEALANAILKIDGSTTPNGYTFFNKIVNVNVDDETLVTQYPIVDIFLFNSEGNISGEQMALRNELEFELRCGVENSLGGNPRRLADKKMNTILSDIKYILYNDKELWDTCDKVEYVSSTREYNEGNNSRRVADLIIDVRITYTQSISNPTISCGY